MSASVAQSGKLSRATTVELGAVVAAVVVVALAAPRMPETLEIGSLAAVLSLALLGQGFVRDVITLMRRKAATTNQHQEEAQCLCLESTIGLGGVLAGILLTVTMADARVSLSPATWPAMALVIWLSGTAIKDLVFQWHPVAIRRIVDHGSIVVRLRAGRVSTNDGRS